MTGPGSAPSSNANKLCKKCKQNVSNAIIKCVKCKDVYHKSCLQANISRGKKYTVLQENVMICDDHMSDLSEVEQVALIAVSDLKRENSSLKSELNALKKEVEQLKIISDMDQATSSEKNLKEELMDSLLDLKKRV
jgi:hypothetical protein